MKKKLFTGFVSMLMLTSVIHVSAEISTINQVPDNKAEDRFEMPQVDQEKQKLLNKRTTELAKDVKPIIQLSKDRLDKLKKSKSEIIINSQGKSNTEETEIINNRSNPSYTLSNIIKPNATDNRERIFNTTVSPYYAMVHIEMQHPTTNQWYVCPDTILIKIQS